MAEKAMDVLSKAMVARIGVTPGLDVKPLHEPRALKPDSKAVTITPEEMGIDPLFVDDEETCQRIAQKKSFSPDDDWTFEDDFEPDPF